MRRIVRLSISALSLGSLLALAEPAVAAPAEQIRIDDCTIFEDYESCLKGHGVVVQNESASGNSVYVLNADIEYTVRQNGQLIYVGGGRTSEKLIQQDGEAQVYHSAYRIEFGYVGETCTAHYNVIISNGEFRHRLDNLECV